MALIALAAPALASANGRIATLQRGSYICETPGDASTQRGIPVPEEGFTVTNGSAYWVGNKNGTYLRSGDMVTMTSGPYQGNRYLVKGERYLKKLDEKGQPTGLRCVRQGSGQG